MTTATVIATWSQVLKNAGMASPRIAIALIAALILVAGLLVQGTGHALFSDNSGFSHYALWGGIAGFLATSLGALPALFLRSIRKSSEDVMLGFAAGMMLAASCFSLLLPGLDAGEQITGSSAWAAALVVTGMAFGVALMLGIDHFTPHEHVESGPCGPGHERCDRAWLFVLAIAIHNLPEGMAVGVGFAQGDVNVGLPLATAIALQDIPEGLAVALTLRAAGMAPATAVLIAALSGLLEPVGALLGNGLAGGMLFAYPIGLGLAAGAMLFVVSHEVIPETHKNGHQTLATLGLMSGFALMMVLDTTLG